jgi:hypothetical protein
MHKSELANTKIHEAEQAALDDLWMALLFQGRDHITLRYIAVSVYLNRIKMQKFRLRPDLSLTTLFVVRCEVP